MNVQIVHQFSTLSITISRIKKKLEYTYTYFEIFYQRLVLGFYSNKID